MKNERITCTRIPSCYERGERLIGYMEVQVLSSAPHHRAGVTQPDRVQVFET